ncbi:TPA: hypothetical protein ACNUZQ_002987 [Citrobacter braakii]|uniref:hypothetical protein n=1 Tax=Citrobacter freundii TaxID=546 RepID=UPI001ED22C6A|nr:hypothetical protein [Citrobacter freundii]EGT0021238.1 HEPN domain-containing protein [Citrobacter freundii]EGT0456864.1 HEPN domain-containing protein [Citrobacter freundii]WNT12857.1 hypothetical protein RRL10_03590 [Citrobacter freundii]HCL6751420.1 HEPN domain-containing protein [Citrobacter freundii]
MKDRITNDRKHPNHWFNQASNLRASAHVLWLTMQSNSLQKEMGYDGGFSLKVACYPVYEMLCGLALELILKAVIVQKNKPVPNSHNLNHLASIADIKISKKIVGLLNFYTEVIVWSGRYPIPRNCDDEKLTNYWELVSNTLTEPVENVGTLQIRRGNGASDWDNFNEIFTLVMNDFKFDV